MISIFHKKDIEKLLEETDKNRRKADEAIDKLMATLNGDEWWYKSLTRNRRKEDREDECGPILDFGSI